MKKSVYISKLGQRYDKTPNNSFLQVPNQALKAMDMINYVSINNTNSLYYSSVVVLIGFINSFCLELLMVA